jgi:superfamily II DNA or RNA helicase
MNLRGGCGFSSAGRIISEMQQSYNPCPQPPNLKGTKMKIKIIDPTICQTDSPKILKEFLTVKKTFWKQGQYAKERNEYNSPLVDRSGNFLTGFLPRVFRECKTRNIPIELEGALPKLKYDQKLEYPTITLFEDQEKLVRKALEIQRGIIKSPMGTGKTILAYAILHPLKFNKAIVLCSSKEINTQTALEYTNSFNKKISVFDSKTKDLSGDIVIGLINSINKLDPTVYCDLFDAILIDETHHASSLDGMYAKFLLGCLAPMRIGLTATTDPEGSENAMSAEGLVGPIIGEFTFKEAVEKKRISKPRLKLLPIPPNQNIRDLRTYQDIYHLGIVFNRIRNNIIADFICEEAIKSEKTSLIFVKLLAHVDILMRIINERGVPCKYVSGETSSEERRIIKEAIRKKELMVGIATKAWTEGTNIPELDIAFNAAGYKSEKPVIQMGGRCLRVSKGKIEGIIGDCLDSGKYLADHCIHRLLTYAELGWLE